MAPLISGKHRSVKISFHLARWFFNVVAGSPWHIFCPTMWSWMLRTKISSQGGGIYWCLLSTLAGHDLCSGNDPGPKQGICNMLILDKSRMLSGDDINSSLLSTAFQCKINISKVEREMIWELRTNRNRIAFLLFRPFLSRIPVQADYRRHRRA